jgi:2-methylcitrate dehydratase
MADKQEETLEETLSRQAREMAGEAIDPETLHLLKRNILDAYAGICASLRDTAMIGTFDRMTSLATDREGITVWGVGRKAHPSEAVFMNTILGRRSDLVNTYMSPTRMGGCHPSDNISLILSLADWLGRTGTDVLADTWLAYRLSCMFANHYDPERDNYDHDAQALFFTPLVIGFMMGLSAHQLTESQRIAGMLGLTINQAAVGDVTDWKHCTFASCAMRGLTSVLMARAGFTGPGGIYEGEAGIDRFLTHSPSLMDPPPDLASITFKRWPALVFCQTPIDAAVDISGRVGDHSRIEKVEVHVYDKAIREAAIPSSWHPASRAARTHSLPYCVAAALVRGTIEYEFFNDDFVETEKAVIDMLPMIKVVEDGEMTQAFPKGAPCRIVVTLKDGSVLECCRSYPRGDSSDPLEDGEIEEKVLKYLTDLTGRDTAKTLIGRIWGMEKERTLDWLVDPLKQKVTTKD